MKCVAKHADFQPTYWQWRCPQCGNGLIDDSCIVVSMDVDADEECDKLHASDVIECVCGYSADGRAFAKALKKANNMETCPCCNGTGVVPKP